MSTILVVCSGNICRSPLAEAFLRTRLERQLGDRAPVVGSAGTIGLVGRPAMPETIEAGQERGVDVTGHAARALDPQLVLEADLILGLSGDHREEIPTLAPGASDRTFTLKEFTRLLEELPPADERADLVDRVRLAHGLRAAGYEGFPGDEDVIDPMGSAIGTYRAVAWEIDEWCSRLADGLYGPESPAEAEAATTPAGTTSQGEGAP